MAARNIRSLRGEPQHEPSVRGVHDPALNGARAGRAVYLQILEAVPPLPLATGTSNVAVTILL